MLTAGVRCAWAPCLALCLLPDTPSDIEEMSMHTRHEEMLRMRGVHQGRN